MGSSMLPLQSDRSFPAPRRRGIHLVAGLALLSLASCVDIIGDFRTTGGAGGSDGSTTSSGTGASSGAPGSGGSCTCDGATCTGSDCVQPAAWIKQFGDQEDQYITGVAVDAENNIIVTGKVSGTIHFGGDELKSAGDYDAFLAKLDAEGNHLHSKRIGHIGTDQATAVAVDSDGNIFVTGAFQGTVDIGEQPETSAGGYDMFIAKLDAGGQFLWTKTFGNMSEQLPISVTADPDGNVIVTGCNTGMIDFGGGAKGGQGNRDIFVLKLDGDGTHLWSLVDGSGIHDCGTRVVTDSSGNVYVAGYFASNFDLGADPLVTLGGRDVFLTKLTPDLEPAWSKTIGGPGDDDVGVVTLDRDENPILTGSFAQSVNLAGDAVVSKNGLEPFAAAFDAEGGWMWGHAFEEPDHQYLRGAVVDPAGDLFICGHTANPLDPSRPDLYVAKVNVKGEVLWKEAPEAALEQAATFITIDTAGSPIMVGNFAGTFDLGGAARTSNGKRDVFIYKLNNPQ
jgi:hypothetical protein